MALLGIGLRRNVASTNQNLDVWFPIVLSGDNYKLIKELGIKTDTFTSLTDINDSSFFTSQLKSKK